MMVRMMPTNPAVLYLSRMSLPITDENIAVISKEMGLDQSAVFQYVSWIGNFVGGNWGVSLVSKLDIRTEFFSKVPYSLMISMGGIFFGAVISYFLGYFSAVQKEGFCDRFSSLLSVFTQSVPGFIVAIFIIYFFGVKLRIARFFSGSGEVSIVTAMAIMALYRIGPWSRIVRNAFREEMKKSYIRFSISSGMPKRQLLFCHAYRPVLCRLISAVMSDFAVAFGGSSVLEFAFTIPGLSYFLVKSMQNCDYTVIQSYVLIVIIWMFFVHLLLNVLLDILDVRRRK